MSNGTVKWFNVKKGYGFIEPEEGGKDIFVHVSALESSGIKNLDDGQKVSYSVETKDGKTFATDLKTL